MSDIKRFDIEHVDCTGGAGMTIGLRRPIDGGMVGDSCGVTWDLDIPDDRVITKITVEHESLTEWNARRAGADAPHSIVSNRDRNERGEYIAHRDWCAHVREFPGAPFGQREKFTQPCTCGASKFGQGQSI